MNVESIAIAGLGLLGRGIATCFLAHGFRVVAYTKGGPEEYARARTYIDQGIRELVERGYFHESLHNDWQGRYIEAQSVQEFASATFVIESVTEDLAIKQQLFSQIEDVVAADVPLASNTSAVPISLLQSSCKHPERVLGMHWAEPAYSTRFLELIRGEQTSDVAMDKAAALAARVGKEPAVVQKDIPGFIVNRLGYAMYREAVHLLETGVGDIETIDRAFRNACGLWASLCGPFRWMDITGGPALYAKAMSGVLPTLNNSADVPETLTKMQAGDRFYSYSPGDAQRWNDLLHEHVWAIREIQERKPKS